jgi:hypothetical protein
MWKRKPTTRQKSRKHYPKAALKTVNKQDDAQTEKINITLKEIIEGIKIGS